MNKKKRVFAWLLACMVMAVQFVPPVMADVPGSMSQDQVLDEDIIDEDYEDEELATPSNPSAATPSEADPLLSRLTPRALDVLQGQIDQAADGDIIALNPGASFGNGIHQLLIEKSITIQGDGSQSLQYGSIICEDSTVVLKGLNIEGTIKSSGDLSLEANYLKGGLDLEDTANTNVKVYDCRFSFNHDQTDAAIRVTASHGENTPKGIYEFGSSPNIFIDEGRQKNTPVAQWPFTESQLSIEKAYWKDGDGADLLLRDISVVGNVKYFDLIRLYLKSPYSYALVPMAGLEYVKKDHSEFNKRNDMVENNDYLKVLYGRSLGSSGQPLPLFYDAVYRTPLGDYPAKDYFFRFKNFGVLKDIGGVELLDQEAIMNLGANNIYHCSGWTPMVPLYVSSHDLISYKGGASADHVFPLPVYQYAADNFEYVMDMDPAKPEFISFPEINLPAGEEFQVNYLKDNIPVSEDGKGIYKIEIFSDSLERIPSAGILNLDTLWTDPGIWTSAGIPDPVNFFYPEYKQAQLTVRDASQDTSVKKVESILPAEKKNRNIPLAVIDSNAVYKNSADIEMDKTKVWLFNDNREPSTADYNHMLGKVKQAEGMENRVFAYHHLALVDYEDGNHLVLTNADKTLFLPYPSDYKAGGKITVFRFEDYQRMPNNPASASSMDRIDLDEITKLEDGFSFQIAGLQLGSFVVAYEKTKTEEETTPKPEEPTVKPEEPTKKPQEPSSGGGNGGGDNGGGSQGTVAPPPEQTLPAQPPSPSPSESIPPSVFPEAPGFQQLPETDGDIVVGEDNRYYYVDEKGVPLAYYDSQKDQWILIENGNVPLGFYKNKQGLPKTGNRSAHANVMFVLCVGGLMTVIHHRKRQNK